MHLSNSNLITYTELSLNNGSSYTFCELHVSHQSYLEQKSLFWLVLHVPILLCKSACDHMGIQLQVSIVKFYKLNTCNRTSTLFPHQSHTLRWVPSNCSCTVCITSWTKKTLKDFLILQFVIDSFNWSMIMWVSNLSNFKLNLWVFSSEGLSLVIVVRCLLPWLPCTSEEWEYWTYS